MTLTLTLHVQPLYPYKGKGIIDHLVHANMDACITSDGSGMVTLGTGSCQVGRPWLFSQGTGHTVGTPCFWYVMNMWARLHIFKMCNVGHGGYYQSSGLYVSVV